MVFPPRGLTQVTAICRRDVRRTGGWGACGPYIWLAQLLRLVASTSSPPPHMMSWSFLLLSWPVRIHIILAFTLVLRGQLSNANGCRHRPFIVDSSDLDAGVTFSGGGWVMKQDDPS